MSTDHLPKTKKVSSKKTLDTFGRKEETRTPDPYVPNVVRYQLRYFPIVSKDNAKLKVFIVTHNSFVQKVPLEQQKSTFVEKSRGKIWVLE